MEAVQVKVDQDWGIDPAEKLKNLDQFCRYAFPAAFVLVFFCVLLPLFFVGPLTPRLSSSLEE